MVKTHRDTSSTKGSSLLASWIPKSWLLAGSVNGHPQGWEQRRWPLEIGIKSVKGDGKGIGPGYLQQAGDGWEGSIQLLLHSSSENLCLTRRQRSHGVYFFNRCPLSTKSILLEVRRCVAWLVSLAEVWWRFYHREELLCGRHLQLCNEKIERENREVIPTTLWMTQAHCASTSPGSTAHSAKNVQHMKNQ